MIPDLLRQFFGEAGASIITVVFYLYPIWLPVALVTVFWPLWVHYIRNWYFASLKYSLIEIKLPIEITKSPQAMELVLDSFWQIGGETTFFDRNWSGKTRPWYSLEIVSTEGTIHFYIWTRASEKDLIESRIYSQYPGVEIYEVPDYTDAIPYDESKYKMTACVFQLVNPNSALPIKTYVDFGLDQNPKEEHKVDPMTPLLEFIGSIGPGEHVWYQIIIHTHKAGADRPKGNKWFKLGFDFEKSFFGIYLDTKGMDVFGKKDWKKDAEAEIQKIRDKTINKEHPEYFPRIMTKGETDTIAAMERTTAKPAFNTGIRAIYIAEKDKYIGSRKNDLMGAFRHFNSVYNGIKPDPGYVGYDNPWQDFMGIGESNMKRYAYSAFKHRGFFFTPYKESKVFIMNGEELATLYHFPGQVAITPTLTRIPSKKAEAPANLPI